MATQIIFTGGGGTLRIGRGVRIKGRLEVNRGGSIRIGDETFLNRACDIRGIEGASVDIGAGCLFSNVVVSASDMHSILDLRTGKRTNPAAGIVIEDNVWMAEDVKIGKGVRIGEGAVIASGSLVTRNIAPFCLAAGRPAKVIRVGVGWNKKRLPMPPLPAPEFGVGDLPLDKEILKLLMTRGQFGLVEAVVLAADPASLPVYARWYLVSARYSQGKLQPSDAAILDGILQEAPGHAAAQKLRERVRHLPPTDPAMA